MGGRNYDVRDRTPVDGRLAAHRSEQRLRGEVVEHLLGVDSFDRDEAERDVGEGLGEHSADADHHARPELRVAEHARNQLAAPVHHRGDEDPYGAVLGYRRVEQDR